MSRADEIANAIARCEDRVRHCEAQLTDHRNCKSPRSLRKLQDDAALAGNDAEVLRRMLELECERGA